MPRVAGYGDWQDRPFPTRLEYMNASQKLTHQGVRDLNGPNANGRHYNGRKKATCPHYRAPDAVATVRVSEPREAEGVVRERNVYYCAGCGEERWVEE